MHNTIAFCQAPAVTTEENIAGVTDQNARVSGDDIFIGKYNKIISMFGGGHSIQSLRAVSPSLRRFVSPYIDPFYSAAEDAYWVVSPIVRPESPIPLETNEALNILALVSELHVNYYNFCGISLAEGPVTPVTGDIRSVAMAAEETLPIGVWTNVSLTLPQDLPVGRYQVVGAQCWSSNPGIFRLVPIGEDYRPGGLLSGGSKPIYTREQRMGKMGVWCEFDQLTPPSLEICPHVANTWYALTLDLLKVG